MLTEKEKRERINRIKKHLVAGKKISDFAKPQHEFQFMVNNANEFKDLVFVKRREVELWK